ncbi:putative protein disulfide-isomerase DDB_G0275025 [Actinia tenebrosa]|uniref:Lipoprotein n=1 Tax=Actinia tenebrosa TaxID=6105 RepID=A0A6P8I0H5_ACTTE|nr:putative protein disulfide-isomerase DDB_G0275025 [Actinia tenebrosa]
MFSKYKNILFYLLVLLLKIFSSCHESTGKSPEYGLAVITAKNYESEIINGDKDAWILAVKDVRKISLEQWKEIEFSVRGMTVRVGIIDPEKDGAFLKRKGFIEDKSYPVARVFPYGGWKIKTAGMKDTKSMKEAKKMALQSLPDDTTKINIMSELEYFVHSSYGTSPPRFPVLLFTKKRQTAALYKALALKYSTYFNFGVVRKPSVEFLQQFHLKDLPEILVMISSFLPNNQLTFSSIPYDKTSYGAVSYLTVAKFLYSVHEKHWKELPNIKRFKGKMNFKEEFVKESKAILNLGIKKEDKSSKEIVVKEITHKNYKVLCKENDLGLCLIAFVDGKDEKIMEKSINLLKDLQRTEDMEGKPLQYLWVNATCHPEYGDVFGIFPHTLPTLLIIKPRQRLFLTQTLQDTSPGDISEMVLKILQGLKNLQRYARFNDMLQLDCRDVKVDENTVKKSYRNQEL